MNREPWRLRFSIDVSPRHGLRRFGETEHDDTRQTDTGRKVIDRRGTAAAEVAVVASWGYEHRWFARRRLPGKRTRRDEADRRETGAVDVTAETAVAMEDRRELGRHTVLEKAATAASG